MPPVSFEDFSKLELRVGRVVEVTAHPHADRLYLLQVDLGGETRRLVAGLKPHYAPDELAGRQVVVIANLAPAVIRGVESQGMLLAADDGSTVSFLTPEKPVQSGAKIR